jgi:hypothetical protein
MRNKRIVVPVAGLVATLAVAVYMVVQLRGQAATAVGDFSNAAVAEVHDSQGRSLLRGQFEQTQEEDDDVERKAKLESTGVDSDATGEAEVEFAKELPTEQEVEFSVQNLQPGLTVSFVIDGTTVGQATVDARGRAEAEIEVTRSSGSR